ncbi:MAG TPA: hypothetical protein VEI97_13650, partial [bacterium]|nr:hypothetical protein [bacterium]
MSSHTFNFSGESPVIANTEAIVDPDGYLRPWPEAAFELQTPGTDLVGHTGRWEEGSDALRANTFPYVLLADEALNNFDGNRFDDATKTHLLNPTTGGPPPPNVRARGNYVATLGGWQRFNHVATEVPTSQGNSNFVGWRGYDFVHQGQEVENNFTVSGAFINDPANQAAGVVTLRAALLIKWTDPRGDLVAEAPRSNLLPPETVDTTIFAYRLPHAALDASVVTPVGTPILTDAPNSTFPLSFRVRDWDATAAEWSGLDIFNAPRLDYVQAGTGTSSSLAAEVQVPALAFSQTLPSSNSGTGEPSDELVYNFTLSAPQPPAQPTTVPGMVRFLDPEHDVLKDHRGTPPAVEDDLHFGIDPDFTVAGGQEPLAMEVVTYQAFHVQVNSSELCTVPPGGVQVFADSTINLSDGMPDTFNCGAEFVLSTNFVGTLTSSTWTIDTN